MKKSNKPYKDRSLARLIATSHYPFKFDKLDSAKQPRFAHIVTLGLGSNVGDSLKILESVFKWLSHHPRVQILYTSPIWRNPAFGFKEQDDFYNSVIILSCALCLSSVHRLVFYLERRFGRSRKRAFANAPRTLDIDIIFFDDLSIKWNDLQIPHYAYQYRESVMLPLSLIDFEKR